MMPQIDIARVPVRSGTTYPPELQGECRGRHRQFLGDAVGLTQFGVNLSRIEAGQSSSLRHWHENEDEFVFMLEGELVLKENDGEAVLKAGDCAGFKGGSGNAHRLINRSSHDAVYLEVGTRAPVDRVHYPDVDLHLERDGATRVYKRKSGESYT